MKKARLSLLCALVAVFVAGSSGCLFAISDNPYVEIIDRNVFNLKPPVVVAPVDPEADRPPPPKLTLAGIATILGRKQVLLRAQVPAKPGQPAQDTPYMIVEGQNDGGIEVLAIDEKAGVVRVNNNGVTQTLSFEKDGAKLPNTPPVAMPVQGVPGLPPGLPVPPPMNPGAVTPAGGNPGFSPTGTRTIPTRSLRLPPSSGVPGSTSTGINPLQSSVGLPAPGAYASATGVNPGQPGTVTLPGFSQVQPGISQSYVPPSVGSAEEQAILIEAMRQKDPGLGAFLPPTPLNPHANLTQEQPIVDPGQQQQQNQIPGQFPGQFPPMPGFPPGPVPSR